MKLKLKYMYLKIVSLNIDLMNVFENLRYDV